MKRKWLAIGIILLFVGTCILPIIPSCRAESEEYHFENVNVFIIGRCRTIGSDGTWMGGLFLGTQPYSEVYVTDTRFEGIRIIIFNTSIFNPCFSISKLINALVFMHDAKGIFFWSCWKQFSARPIPPIVFVLCQASDLLIQC